MDIISIADFKRMLLFFQKIKHLVYVFMLMLSIGACSSAPSSEDLVQEFYTRAKEHQSELSVLFNVSFTVRGTRNDKPLIPRLEVALNEHETITLPGIDSDMTDEEIQNLSFFENMKIYSQRIGLSDSIAYQHVKDYCRSIVELAHKLEAYKVQSTPRLGRFIIFSLTPEDQVIYIPDVSDVDNDYWKNFFKTGRKIEDHWYVRSIESSEE